MLVCGNYCENIALIINHLIKVTISLRLELSVAACPLENWEKGSYSQDTFLHPLLSVLFP